MSAAGRDLPLIQDALDRVLRTLIGGALAAVPTTALLVQLFDLDVAAWKVLGVQFVGAVIAAAIAGGWRLFVDPSRLPSLEPKGTPHFEEPPLPPPVPMG